MLKRICVFCGSSSGERPEYAEAARQMGTALTARGLELVYGGGRVGLMGTIADATLAAGGRVIGVIPQALFDKEVGHSGLTDLHIVKSMHERKALMAELSDAFIAMPGGFGTFEEFFEVLTWAQLGFHRKACAILNVAGYYDQMLGFFDHIVAEGFVRAKHREIVVVSASVEGILDHLLVYQPPVVDKWLEQREEL